MKNHSLEKFIQEIKKTWVPYGTEVVQNSRSLFVDLLKAPSTEPWLAQLLENPPEFKEIYHDPEHNFILLAYSETKGTYRMPHDHGSGWVLYGVRAGAMEMGTYARHVDQRGVLHLINRDTNSMGPGDHSIYLPGDIHHTRCLSDSALILRFTSCDLKKEDEEGRMIRYVSC